MLPRLLLLIFLCGLSALQALAQTYEPGLLVLSSGDTLRGEVENGFWIEPPTFIRYRATAGSSSQLYKPRQLRAVRFAGGRYFRYEALPIDYAAENRISYLPEGRMPDIRIDSVLAEVLVEGAATLQRVVYFRTTHYLIRRPGQPVLDVSAQRYLRRNSKGGREVVDGNNYHALLGMYFGDCPAVVGPAATIAFTAAELAGVVQTYNTSCAPTAQPSQSWVTEARPRRRVALRGGLLAGLRYNRIDAVYGPSNGACVDCKARPFGGLYAELFQPGRTAAVYGELSLSSFRSRGSEYASFTQTGFVYTPFVYRALLGTARLGVRFVVPLAREQQMLLGLGYELNSVFSPQVKAGAVLPAALDSRELKYAYPTLLPNFTLGWRAQRLTLTADGQLYGSNDFRDDRLFFARLFIDKNFALRLGVAYRLGGNPDAAQAKK